MRFVTAKRAVTRKVGDMPLVEVMFDCAAVPAFVPAAVARV